MAVTGFCQITLPLIARIQTTILYFIHYCLSFAKNYVIAKTMLSQVSFFFKTKAFFLMGNDYQFEVSAFLTGNRGPAALIYFSQEVPGHATLARVFPGNFVKQTKNGYAWGRKRCNMAKIGYSTKLKTAFVIIIDVPNNFLNTAIYAII